MGATVGPNTIETESYKLENTFEIESSTKCFSPIATNALSSAVGGLNECACEDCRSDGGEQMAKLTMQLLECRWACCKLDKPEETCGASELSCNNRIESTRKADCSVMLI